MLYYGILDGKDGVWGVRIPEMPGCCGGGATQEEAISDAISAISEWLSDGGTPVSKIYSDVLKEVKDGEILTYLNYCE